MRVQSCFHGDGPHAMSGLPDQGCGTAVKGLGGAAEELADHGVAGLAADEREGAVPVEGADDGVFFKVPHAGAVLRACRAPRDMTPGCNASAAGRRGCIVLLR
jgi:hypothetical protein